MRAAKKNLHQLLFLMQVSLMSLVLVACATKAPDTRYLTSEQRPPLVIPAGMDTPDYNPQMQVPAAQGNAEVNSGATDSSPEALELPPRLDGSN